MAGNGPVVIEVVFSQWGAGDGEPFAGGVHEIEKPSKELLRHIAAAESSGIVNVKECSPETRAVLDGHIESDEDSAARLDAAMADGRWQEGNLLQFETDPVGYGRVAEGDQS